MKTGFHPSPARAEYEKKTVERKYPMFTISPCFGVVGSGRAESRGAGWIGRRARAVRITPIMRTRSAGNGLARA